MQAFIQTLVNGLITGCIYALIALGYTMVYGVLKLLNFAHGDVYMVGAYIGYFVIQWFGGPDSLSIPVPLLIILMLLIAGLGTGCWGSAIERFAYRPLRDAPRIAPLITALGVSFVLENTVLLLFGGFVRSYNTPSFISLDERDPHRRRPHRQRRDHDHRPDGVCCVTGSMQLVDRTTLGKSMRAVASDREAAEMLGIDVDRTIALTFFIGSVLAGFAGRDVGAGVQLDLEHDRLPGRTEGVHRRGRRRHRQHPRRDGRRPGDRAVRVVQPQLHLDQVLRSDRVRDPDPRRC